MLVHNREALQMALLLLDQNLLTAIHKKQLAHLMCSTTACLSDGVSVESNISCPAYVLPVLLVWCGQKAEVRSTLHSIEKFILQQLAHLLTAWATLGYKAEPKTTCLKSLYPLCHLGRPCSRPERRATSCGSLTTSTLSVIMRCLSMPPYCVVQRSTFCAKLPDRKINFIWISSVRLPSKSLPVQRHTRKLNRQTENAVRSERLEHLMVHVASDNLVQIPYQRQGPWPRYSVQIIHYPPPDAAPDLPGQENSQRGCQNTKPRCPGKLYHGGRGWSRTKEQVSGNV